MLLDTDLSETLANSKTSLKEMSVSKRIEAWESIYNQKLDTSAINFNPSFVPPMPFNPEELGSVFGIDITYNKSSNKIEPVNLQPKDTKGFTSAQAKSLNDIKDLGNNLYEGAKLLDITGVLHWQDYTKAQEAFEKEPNTQTSLNLLLCSLAVIPAIGIATSPAKAIKGGISSTISRSLKDFPKDISKLSQAEKELRLTPITKEVDQLLKSNKNFPKEVNTGSLNNALIILDIKRNKVTPTVPAHVFKDMIKNFKAGGGKFERSDGYSTGFKPDDNIIRLSPKDFIDNKSGFRSIIAHEMGHSFTTPKANAPNAMPSSIPKFKLNKSPDKNAYDKPYSRKEFTEYIDGTIYDELNADLEVLRRMKLGGASKAQMSDYAKDAIQSIKTYKRGLITQSRGTYSDYIAIKNVLLSNPALSTPTSKILVKDPEIIGDFDKLLEKLANGLTPQDRSQRLISTLKVKLQEQKKIAYDNHKTITDKLHERLTWKNEKGIKEQRYLDNNLNNHATEAFIEKNLAGFKDFKQMVSDNIQSFRVRELEAYVLDRGIKTKNTAPRRQPQSHRSYQSYPHEVMSP